MYYHYIPGPKYRCSTCGRRCGANGHAGCGNAELLNDTPDVLLPLGVWFVHFVIGCFVCPLCWLIGWDFIPKIWGPLGWFWVALTIILVVATKVSDAADKKKHKQYQPTVDPIKDAHLDIINKEYNNGR